MCVAECLRLAFSYPVTTAGVQNGRLCFCGLSSPHYRDYGAYGPSTGCNIPCAGNAAEKCGGVNANAIYNAAG